MELRIHLLKWICFCLSMITICAILVKYFVGENPIANQDNFTYFIYISIIVIFIWSTLRCGNANGYLNQKELNIKKSQYIENEGWFWSTTCTSLGLIGTIWGMIIMAQSFIGFNPVNEQNETVSLITATGSGMGTALYTTLLGQVCSQILNFQYFFLSQTIEKVKLNETS